ARSLDYNRRVSDKVHYVSPTRGQLGNALKCVWAAPFVAGGGGRGVVEVEARGVHHRVEVSLDRIAQEPRIDHRQDTSDVKTGTSVRLHWPQAASSLQTSSSRDFYDTEALLRA